MGEVVVQVAKWALKIGFFSSMALGVVILFGILTSYLVVGFSMSVLADIFAFIQIWLPFNLNVLLLWLGLTASAYIAYRVSVMAYTMISNFISR